MIEKQKKRKFANKTNVYINLHQIHGLGMEFTACYVELMPVGALTSFTRFTRFTSAINVMS